MCIYDSSFSVSSRRKLSAVKFVNRSLWPSWVKWPTDRPDRSNYLSAVSRLTWAEKKPHSRIKMRRKKVNDFILRERSATSFLLLSFSSRMWIRRFQSKVRRRNEDWMRKIRDVIHGRGLHGPSTIPNGRWDFRPFGTSCSRSLPRIVYRQMTPEVAFTEEHK